MIRIMPQLFFIYSRFFRAIAIEIFLIFLNWNQDTTA